MNAYAQNSAFPYTIKSAHSSTAYYLGIKDNSTNQNEHVVLRSGTVNAYMRWRFLYTNNRGYKIYTSTSSYALSSNNYYIVNGLYTNNSDFIDEWRLFPATTEYWESDSYEADYWETEPSIYAEALSSSSNFYFTSGLSTAKSQWQNALGLTFGTSNESNADIRIYAGELSLVKSKYESDNKPNTWPTEAVGYVNPIIRSGAPMVTTFNNNQYSVYQITAATCYISNVNNEDKQKNVFTHELGHAMGYYGHSKSTSHSNVMYKSLTTTYQLSSSDINHIKQFYE